MTDKIARRPHGRQAREIYGGNSPEWAWPAVLEALALTPDDRLLDIGCGGGSFLRHAAATTGATVQGVDHSRGMVKLAAPFAVYGKAEELPFADAEFTAVSSIVAFFFPDAVQALREMRRVLDPERGRLAVYTTAPEAKGTEAAPYPLATRGHFRTDDELAAVAREAGLRNVTVRRLDELAQLLTAQP
ncbi:MAG TPA: methyltransferase domain-containing protein [Gaiellaceae bacterium]|nr:methyltransferase domain-containing protein [Gaiellaceae bacterium]